MTTIPRHSLVSFADYKQKSLAVNGKINLQPKVPCGDLFMLSFAPAYCLYLQAFYELSGSQA